MDKFVIEGGRPLKGRVQVSGSKNAALPILCTAILADTPCTFHNIPRLKDISTMVEVLNVLGLQDHQPQAGTLVLDPAGIRSYEAPYDLVKSMRASILVLGPLLAKFRQAKVSLPGGCAIGVRPVDLHLKALTKMGARIDLSHGYIMASTDGLKGTRIVFDNPTVGGTENIMMAAALAEGTTIIEGAAQEPEIPDLAQALIKMGAHIEGAGGRTITIEGVQALAGCEHTVIPDRIETGTLMTAAAITKGTLTIGGVRPDHNRAVMDKFAEMGVAISELDETTLFVNGEVDLKPLEVSTAPFPGFPTDMQAQIMALASVADGTSSITETIFENRFMHVPELSRMGANLEEKGRTVIVRGIAQFQGASVMATDLRASACLVLAALNAKGLSEVRRIYHLDRGYEGLEHKLIAVGARVERKKGGL